MADLYKRVIDYHDMTKHHSDRYARSAGYLDWENQPAPFRVFSGTKVTELPTLKADPEAPYMALYRRTDKEGAPLSAQSVASFLELSMGIAAWKSYGGSTWALRMNPSSGNLHPTELHLVLPEVGDIGAGVYHYDPFQHALEMRAPLGEPKGPRLGQGAFLAGLTSIYWRESWKYGERSFRYINLNTGHAMAAMSFSAALLGWRVTRLDAITDAEAAKILGLDRVHWKDFESEEIEALFLISPATLEEPAASVDAELARAFEGLNFLGEPNQLSRDHYPWPSIDEVALITLKGAPQSSPFRHGEEPFIEEGSVDKRAASLIRARRSAQAYDATTRASLKTLLAILDRTVPRQGKAPFDISPHEARINLLLFIHRVDGLQSGLYLYMRNDRDSAELKAAFRSDFLWERVGESPLYLLEKGDLRALSAFVSCAQDIASDGAFSLAMIARFSELIEEDPHAYRRLHWEAGIIGQTLYLEATARSLGATGIGCFLDDSVHELLGLDGHAFQDLYHFTIGRPVVDTRITTLPPYHHLETDR